MDAGYRLTHYEILDRIGAGGMGEVYRARDTRLDRDVAVKVLPPDLAGDHERLARFEREAKLLAALNHANIAVIHGFEEADGVRFLAMELVEGPTLDERMEQGPVELDEALEIGRQIAEALEAAHEKGIVHRDLKPANVKITPEGTVKVLDFGLAKALGAGGSAAPASPEISASPTMLAATGVGVIMGTAAYMSPEQARGQAVDRRADVWAFGVLMYELLTEQRLFAEDTMSDTLAAVLRADIDLDRLPADTPPSMRRLIRRCLSRDPRRRLRDIGDARIELEETLAGGDVDEGAATAVLAQSDSRSGSARGLMFGGWIVALGALAAVAWMAASGSPPPAIVQLSIAPPPGGFFTSPPVVSPTGGRVAYSAAQEGVSHVWIRELAAADSLQVPGTEGATEPFWSRDGEWIGYSEGGVLYKIRPSGSERQRLADLPDGRAGARASWGADDVILVDPRARTSPLLRVDARGGELRDATTLAEGDIVHIVPLFLPDGRRFLFTALRPYDDARLTRQEWIGEIDGPSRLIAADRPLTTATGGFHDGWVLYGGDSVSAYRLDLDRAELSSEPITVVSRTAQAVAVGGPVLAYQTSDIAGGTRLVLLDRSGTVIRDLAPPGNYYMPRLSHDGRLVAAEVHYEGDVVGDLEIFDVDARRPSRNLSLNPESHDAYPVWTSDDTRVVYDSTRGGGSDIFIKAASGVGTDRAVFASDARNAPMDLGADDRTLLLRVSSESGWDVYTMDLEAGGAPEPYLQTEHDEIQPVFSPDGRWVAYASDDVGRFEIYIESFPREGPGGARFRITTEGGEAPRWRRDGGELYYLAPDGGVMAVAVELGEVVEWSNPELLFRNRVRRTGGVIRDAVHYDVSADGERFVAVVSDAGNEAIQVIVNWPWLLPQR